MRTYFTFTVKSNSTAGEHSNISNVRAPMYKPVRENGRKNTTFSNGARCRQFSYISVDNVCSSEYKKKYNNVSFKCVFNFFFSDGT